MIRPRSIKRKLQWWVVVIFVLTGTAGWAGIWGLLYISQTTKEVSGKHVERAQQSGVLETDLAAARRVERDWLLETEAGKRAEQGGKLGSALGALGPSLEALRAKATDTEAASAVDELRGAHERLMSAWPALAEAVNSGKPWADVRPGAYAEFDKRLSELEAKSHALTAGAFGAIKGQTDRLYDWIWILQIALFATVLVCQVFSAWAGWQLSRTLTGELNALKDNADRISMGDLKNEVKVATTDVEIVALGEALDRLRVSLGKAMDRLAKRSAQPQPQPQGEQA
ncbi:MAG: methyl-accepting chemotaxis protein [Myxococcales bacterium]|nr:methyl-accepting chemotaxis protein [Myxococcales bacterium]